MLQTSACCKPLTVNKGELVVRIYSRSSLFALLSSALASPEFEGRTGEELGSHLGQLLQSAYCGGRCLDLHELCVVPGKICWNVYVDTLVCGSMGKDEHTHLHTFKCSSHTRTV